MMNRYFKYSFFFLLSLLLVSCEDVVQIKLDQGAKIYVIDAFVNDLRQDQVIKITTNDSYFSNQAPPGVLNAKVKILDLSTSETFTFTEVGKGKYVYILGSSDTIGRVGHFYQLSVTLDGYEYTSTCLQKRTAIIDSVSAVYNDGSAGPFGGPEGTYNCFLFARDIADNNPDYYWLKTYRNDTLFNSPTDLNISIDGTNGVVTDAPTPFIDFTPPATFLGFKTYRKLDNCRVEIHSISRPAYYFFLQAINQINNGGLFATTPENIKTNIITPQGATYQSIGWFNMATVATQSVLIQ